MARLIRFSYVVVVALVTLAAGAQEGPATPDPAGLPQPNQPVKPPPAPPRNARITGTVLCADTHRPARGAIVIIMPVPPADAKKQTGNGSEAMARVASDGTYVAEHMAAGEYSVIAMLPGYLSPMDDLTSADMSQNSPEKSRAFLMKYGTVDVRAQETARFDLSLQRGAAMSGRVLYSDGSPASQITIDVQDVNAKPAASKSPEDAINAGTIMRSLFMHQSQGTDDQGRFRISGLRPGTYRVAAVQASTDPMGQFGGDDGMGFLMGFSSNPTDLHIYSGDTLHKKSAKTYELRSGDEVSGIDITVPADAFHHIQGRLSATDGRAISTATLTLTDTTDDSLAFHTDLEHDGTFIFPAVPAGTYSLAATQARIGTVPDGFPENMPVRAEMIKATNAFADGNTAVIVKESDVSDVNLSLTEVPLPPDANKQQVLVPEPSGMIVTPQP
jgi:hypothetical protein